MSDIWDALENESHGESLEEEMFAWLSAYMDGETTPKERRLVEAYLREEPEAEAVLRLLEAAEAELANDVAEPPAGLRDAILARTTRKPSLLPKALPWAGGLAAAGALSVALYVAQPHEGPNSIESAPLASAVVPGEQPTGLRSVAETEVVPPHLAAPAQADSRPEGRTPTVRTASRQTRATRPDAANPARNEAVRNGPKPDRGTFVPTASSGQAVPVPASYERLPAAYASEESITVRAEPKPLDPAVMPPDTVAQSDSGSAAGRRSEAPPAENQQKVLPAAREKLRESLQQANQGRAAVTDDELNAPRKRISSS
jgi:anti-sigma factor RsiW